jgi:hypothetical protein
LFDSDSDRNFLLEGDEDGLVEKLIELLDDPAMCDVMEENPRQVIENEINSLAVTGCSTTLQRNGPVADKKSLQ